MVDIHTHILPKMDDGSRSVRQSIRMLRWEVKQGVERVVLTPHYYADRETPNDFVKRRAVSIERLESRTAGIMALPQWYLGAEVAFFQGMSRIEDIESLCIGGTNAILIEMPFSKWSKNILDELHFLVENRGIQPIIAHIERYMRYQPIGTIRRLCEAGVWMQVNASFFIRWQTSLLAIWMLKKKRIQFIGSDCHDMIRRPPNIGGARALIEKRLGKGSVSYLDRMEKRLLEGD